MLKLNIGCGPNPLEGWYNVDLHAQVIGVGLLDATKRFPYPDDTFDRIFTEHMIEHITYEEGQRMLAECYRVMKPGGRLRVSTPDLEWLTSLTTGQIPGDRLKLTADYIVWACTNFNPAEPVLPETVVNNFVRAWGHQYIYTHYVLAAQLDNLGFKNQVWRRVGESDDLEFRNLENVGRMPEGFLQLETMTVEAEKPGA
jgi:predicted SAM-dependent methyltransferase